MKKFILPIVLVLGMLGMTFLFVGLATGNQIFWFVLALLLVAPAAIMALLIPNERPIVQTKKITTVHVDDILDGCPHAIECFWESDLNVSFGDARYTLIDKTMFQGLLDDAGLKWDEETLNMEQTPLDFELKKVYNRLDELDESILIRLDG